MKLKNPYEKAKNIREGHLFAAWNEGYAGGLADGARRERGALRRWLDNKNLNLHTWGKQKVRNWLTARSRRGKNAT